MSASKCIARLVSLWTFTLLWHVQWTPALSFFNQAHFFFNPANMILESQSVPVYDYGQQQFGMATSGGYGRPMPPTGNVDMTSLIPAAIQSRHSVEYRDVPVQPIKPQSQAILVEANALPLTILFRSASSSLNIMQQHIAGEGDVQESRSEDEPHRLIHQVVKPIIQEVHEIISPYRHVTQEIQPVQEEIQTIVARGVETPTNYKSAPMPSSYGQNMQSYMPQTNSQMIYQMKSNPQTNYKTEQPISSTQEPTTTTTTSTTPSSESESDSDSSEESLNLSTESANSTVLDEEKAKLS